MKWRNQLVDQRKRAELAGRLGQKGVNDGNREEQRKKRDMWSNITIFRNNCVLVRCQITWHSGI